METSTTEEAVYSAAKKVSGIRQVLRFVIHAVVVYAVVSFCSMSLAGFTYSRVLPLIQQYQSTLSPFEFVFSHVFLFSFYPALVIAFIYAHWYEHKVAYLVWIVPLTILAYKFLTFPAPRSVFASGGHLAPAFHQYFAGNFHIIEFHSYREMFEIALSNPDMVRGLQQYRFTAPFYAGLGYAIGTFLGIRVEAPRLHAALRSIKPHWSPKKQAEKHTSSSHL